MVKNSEAWRAAVHVIAEWTWLSTEQQQHLDKILILEKTAMPYNFFNLWLPSLSFWLIFSNSVICLIEFLTIWILLISSPYFYLTYLSLCLRYFLQTISWIQRLILHLDWIDWWICFGARLFHGWYVLPSDSIEYLLICLCDVKSHWCSFPQYIISLAVQNLDF